MSNWDSLVDWADQLERDPPRRKRVAVTAIIAGLFVLVLSYRHIYNAFAGPFPLDEQELVSMKDVPYKRYISVRRGDSEVKWSELTDSGVYEQILSHGAVSYGGDFRWLSVDRERVLVHVSPGRGTDTVEGVLREVENPSGRLSLKHAAHLMIDSDSGWLNWALAAAAAGALLVLGGLDQLRRVRKGPQIAGSFLPPRSA